MVLLDELILILLHRSALLIITVASPYPPPRSINRSHHYTRVELKGIMEDVTDGYCKEG